MPDKIQKIPVYFIPGLAAGRAIFDYIKLPKELFEIHILEWLIPESKDETLKHYVKRMRKGIKHTEPVLIGVSFGGIIAQEISRIMPVRKLILISSVKNRSEFPKRMIFMQKTGLYKLIPYKKISKINNFDRFSLGKNLKTKARLYNKYLSVRDEKYLYWAFHNMLNWPQKHNDQKLIHIHGKNDEIFPIKNIRDTITVNKGRHDMIIMKGRKISKILQEVILNNANRTN